MSTVMLTELDEDWVKIVQQVEWIVIVDVARSYRLSKVDV